MKTLNALLLFCLLCLLTNCGMTNKIHPADMKYHKKSINQHKSAQKVLKIKFCNKN